MGTEKPRDKIEEEILQQNSLQRIDSSPKSCNDGMTWDELDERIKESIERGIIQAKAGKLTDAFEFLKRDK